MGRGILKLASKVLALEVALSDDWTMFKSLAAVIEAGGTGNGRSVGGLTVACIRAIDDAVGMYNVEGRFINCG